MISKNASPSPARTPAARTPRLQAAALLLLLPSLPSCSLPDDTAAVVNNREIPAVDLERSHEKFLSQFGEISSPGAEEAARTRKALLDRLIDRELMVQEVEKANLHPTETEIAGAVAKLRGGLKAGEFESVLADAGLSLEEWREGVVRDLSLEKLQQVAVYDTVSVSDGEIEEYRARHRNDYELPEEVRASQILVRTREEARKAAGRIRKGEPFDTVARDLSLSPDAESGGDLGYFARGQMPQEFDAVVFSLPPGKLSPVVETTYGHHLFLVTDRREARRLSDEEIREEVRTTLLASKRELAFRTWIESLRSRADIRYNDDVIEE